LEEKQKLERSFKPYPNFNLFSSVIYFDSFVILFI